MWGSSNEGACPAFWTRLLLLPTVLLLCVNGKQWPADYGINPRFHSDAPQSRLILNPFNIFGNPRCDNNGNEGICYGEVECLALAGTFGNFCDGFITGLCCTFLRTCEMRTSQEVAYFRNVQYPLSDNSQEQCTFTVVKQSASFCGLKLDMEKFELPSDGLTKLLITGIKDDTLAPITGSHTGLSYQFDISEIVDIFLNVQSSSGDKASWNIKATQIQCSDWTSEILPGTGNKGGGTGNKPGGTGNKPGGTGETDGSETSGIEGGGNGQVTVSPPGAIPTSSPPTTTSEGSAKPPAPEPFVPTTNPPAPSPPSPPPSSRCGVKGPDYSTRKRTDIDLLISRFDDDSSFTIDHEPRRRKNNKKDENHTRRRNNNKKDENRRRKNNRKHQGPQGPDIVRSRPASKEQVPFITNDFWDVPVLNETLFWQYMGPMPLFQGRITYGQVAGIREYPWQVAMKVNGRFHCGGSIIGDQYVLTAAHCVTSYQNTPSIIKLSLGDWDLKLTVEQPHVSPTVSRVTVHPGYSRTTLQNDIAVLKLQDKIDFSPAHIGPICLPPSVLSPEGESAIITGWGRNEDGDLQTQLHELKSEVVSNVLCDMQWRDNGAPRGFIVPSMMCMEAVGGDSCNGDSGGPSVMEVPKGSGSYVQIGIVSFGSGSCTDESLPGVYTRVTYFLDWINQQMK